MKTRKSEEKPFTMADFEKGLVLAGLLTPRNVQELDEIEVLNKYESEQLSLEKETKKLFFPRVVLAAEIVSQLHEEPTFGRVKFQKLVFLCEYVAQMNLEHRYWKQAAGPFDNKFMHTIESQFQKNKWFAVEKIKQSTYSRSKYLPLAKCTDYRIYYSVYFKKTKNSIAQIIELFRKKDTAFAEISATLFACYIELKHEGTLNQEELLNRFYEWSENKKQYEKQIVLDNWTWLQQNEIVPLEEDDT